MPPPLPATMPARQPRTSNIVGFVGMSLVFAATAFSPTGFLGVTLFLLVPMGLGGLVMCGLSLGRKPRWPGVSGLVVGLLCLASWAAFFGWTVLDVQRTASAFGMTVGQNTSVNMAAMALTEAAESQRLPDGTPPPPSSISLAALNPTDQIDPWGRPYLYVLVPTPRGFTFMSDGPDRISNTADDIDLLTIQTGGMFPLPRISKPPGGP